MSTQEERRLQARADDIERELRSRRSTSEKQAEAALRGDRRRVADDEHEDDVEEDEPLRLWGDESKASSASERQAARATRGSSRA